jgi:deoxyribose-phosphate aldolase
MTDAEIAKTIDLAVLKPTATRWDAIAQANTALKYGLASLCVRPDYIRDAYEILKGTTVAVSTVIGFPHGYGPYGLKVAAVEDAFICGAVEFDMVMNIGYLKSGELNFVEADIANVVRTAQRCAPKCMVKVILETCLLTDEEIIVASKIAEFAGADYVKTSTGFSTGGATHNAVRLMLDTVGNRMGVKASGGIKTREQAEWYLMLGCKRLGVGSIKGILT